MPSILITPQAGLDLYEIGLYLAQHSLRAAEKMLMTIDKKCRLLAESPEMGRTREELARGLRSFPADPYVIFYKPRHDGIEIIRVLHGARDIENTIEE